MRRRVFIDSSFVSALLDPSDARHDRARTAFDDLLAEYERGTTVLHSSEAVRAEVDHPWVADVLAVCDVARERRWLRRTAERVELDHPEVDRRRATTLVLMSRLGIGEIASFDGFFDRHAIRTVPC
jgi:predicted nucleic acid-binding protein